MTCNFVPETDGGVFNKTVDYSQPTTNVIREAHVVIWSARSGDASRFSETGGG